MIRLVLLSGLVMLLLMFSPSSAEIPHLINYQGMLTTPAGSPVANEQYDLTFKIYGSESGDDSLWWEYHTNVDVTNGLFNIILGSISGLDLPFDADYWLGIRVGTDAELTPRTRLTSVGYAYRARVADSAAVAGSGTGGAGGWVDDGSVVRLETSTDKVGIGTTSPQAGLHLKGNWFPNSFMFLQSDTGQDAGIRLYEGADVRWHIFNSSADSGLRIYNSDGSKTVFFAEQSSGNVGIGEMSPSYKLHVKGTIRGENTGGGYGVSGLSNDALAAGVKGENSGGGFGVRGITSGSGCGVYGANVVSGRSGKLGSSTFGVYYSGGLAGTGSKSCIVKTSKGPTLLYCQESPESWFEDFGEAKLSAGRCYIELDPFFLETVTINEPNPMKVFIQLNDDCNGTYVERGRTGFDVIELQGGQSNARFTYRVVAKRSGFEDKRLNVCEAAKTDPYLYPEMKEKVDRE